MNQPKNHYQKKNHPQDPPKPTNQNNECSSSSEAAPETPLGTAKAGMLSWARLTSPGTAQLSPLKQVWTAAISALHRAEEKQTQLRNGEHTFQHFQYSHLLSHSIHSLKIHILRNFVAVDSQTV